ncbi:F25 protein [Hirschfeldia incana]|nr:F25 protein [Hirschfeldia incana]
MTGTSASEKSGKKNSKGVPLATVKDEFASPHKRNACTKIEYEILKENHETLKIDYESLEKRVKLAEETYEVMKKLLQGKKAEGLEEDGVREGNNDKDEYEKMESEGKAKIEELRKIEEELSLAIKRGKEDSAKLEDKFVALAERFCVVEADCAYLKSLYDAEVAASGMGGNKLNSNVKKDATGICVLCMCFDLS